MDNKNIEELRELCVVQVKEIESLQCRLEIADMRINALVKEKAQAERRLFDATETQIAIAATQPAQPVATVDTAAWRTALLSYIDARADKSRSSDVSAEYDALVTVVHNWQRAVTAQAVAEAHEAGRQQGRGEALNELTVAWQAEKDRADKAEAAIASAPQRHADLSNAICWVQDGDGALCQAVEKAGGIKDPEQAFVRLSAVLSLLGGSQQHAQAALSDEKIEEIGAELGMTAILEKQWRENHESQITKSEQEDYDSLISFACAILAASQQPAAAPTIKESLTVAPATHPQEVSDTDILRRAATDAAEYLEAVAKKTCRDAVWERCSSIAIDLRAAIAAPAPAAVVPEITDAMVDACFNHPDKVTAAGKRLMRDALTRAFAAANLSPAQAQPVAHNKHCGCPNCCVAQPVADADKAARNKVAKALGLHPDDKFTFAWEYLLGVIEELAKDDEIDHGETVLRVQQALGITDTGWVSPDAVLHYLEKAIKATQPPADASPAQGDALSQQAAEAAFEVHRIEQGKIAYQPGLNARPCFIAGWEAAIRAFVGRQ
jgi:hypothetical protein